MIAVTDRHGYHSDRYIFPIGYECSRKYPSMIDPETTVEYTSRVEDGRDGPRFEVDASDQPGVILSGNTPSGAWSQIVKAANKIRARAHSNAVSGPDMYGLTQNVIKALIQELPGAKELTEIPGVKEEKGPYAWQTFVEDADPMIQYENSREAHAPTKKKSTYNNGAKRKASRIEGEEPAWYERSMSPGSGRASPGFGAGGLYGSSSSSSFYSKPEPKDPYALPIDPYALPSGPSIPSTIKPAYYDPYAIPPPVVASSSLIATPLPNPFALPPSNPYSIPSSSNPYALPSSSSQIDPTLDPQLASNPLINPNLYQINPTEDPTFTSYVQDAVDPSLS